MSRRTWGRLWVVGLVVGALVWQGCGDVQSSDADAVVPSITPILTVAPAPAITTVAATSQPQYAPSPTAKAIVASGDAVAAKPQVAADSQELLAETPISAEEDPIEELSEKEISCLLTSSSLMGDPGFVSLDERIFRSSVIARATMRSVSAASLEYYTPTVYYPMKRFTFDVHEYLKGSGGDVITADMRVDCSCGCSYDSEQEAISSANDWISGEADRRLEYKAGHWQEVKSDRWWENRESIIFLEEDELGRSEASGQSAATMYKFIPWNEYRYPIYNYASTYEPYFGGDEYSILSERNRVWLPAAAASSGASGAGESRFMLGNRPKDLHPDPGVSISSWFATDISLSDLKSRIKEVADMVKQSGGWAGYEECLRAKFSLFRDPYGPHTQEFQIQSGQWMVRVVDSRFRAGSEYDIFFLEGDDKRFFEFDIIDADGDPHNGYSSRLKIARPLARGDYSVMYHHQPGFIRPCIDASAGARRYVPVANVTWTIRASAPAGTLHEAFFDPVAIFDFVTSGAAVGADSDNGVLTPAAFSAAGSPDAEIRRVDWRSNVVKIEIVNPPASLTNHHIDFIELDGAIALRLDFDDAAVSDVGAVQTFSWVRCGRPWHAGDKLMLRISESPTDLVGATNLKSCSNAAAEQTPTPGVGAAGQ